ncbi:MAG: sigma 54-interacting transcriptional regulator [Polyangiaceae bacterium]|nr:sigma 54-interacting transcriptional regulator [Polyangiaceae bacterium]
MKHREPPWDAALTAAAGACVLLDADLRVRFATDAAARLLGGPVPVGISAPAWLCGDRPKRPIAEALAAGRPVHGVVPRPSAGAGGRALSVRSLPLHEGARLVGWMLIFGEAARPTDGEVQLFGMWTQDPSMKRMFHILEKVARDDVTVLVRGETGSGKELVAAAVHGLSSRSRGPFRAINCAALPGTLLESELFGHVKGAFTGAVRDMKGHFQLAHGGTLLLDEVAELPLELQAKLLRAIETRAVVPVGGREPIPIDVRIVSATHRALRAEVEAGRFRADLMYRLRVIPVFLPPLRERPGDVALLVDKLVPELNLRSRRAVARVEPAALAALERYDWPGNVRELKNVLAYAFAIGDGPVLSLSDLPRDVLDADAVTGSSPAAEGRADASSPEAARITRALARATGNREHAARLLGVSRVTLWRRMRALGLDEPARRRSSPSA